MKIQIPQSISLKASVNNLEDSIITLSGPALAISGVIAGVDLVTGGHLLQQYAWFTLAWALCLLLTLDFQVLALGARAHQVYLSNKSGWRKFGEIALSFAIAGAISMVSIQMQSIIARVNGVSGLSIDQAAAQLGINEIWLIWERSALVLVLIFLSGWFREEQEVQPIAPAATSSISDETMQLLLAKLAKLDEIERRLNAPVITMEEEVDRKLIEQPVEPETGVDQLAISPPVERDRGFGDVIELLLQTSPGLDEQAISTKVGCSVTTARKWKQRLEVPAAAESEQSA